MIYRGSKNLKIVYLLFVLCISSCKPDLEVPQPKSGEANFSKSITVGDNFLSGYQDGALYRKGQEVGVAVLLARQFSLAGGGNFFQPLINDNYGLGLNPKPWEGIYVTKEVLGYRTDCQGVTGLYPLNS